MEIKKFEIERLTLARITDMLQYWKYITVEYRRRGEVGWHTERISSEGLLYLLPYIEEAKIKFTDTFLGVIRKAEGRITVTPDKFIIEWWHIE